MSVTGAAQSSRDVVSTLIVDDHSLICDAFGVALAANGEMSVEAVHTVDDALKAIARNGRYDVILLDYDIPGMDGLEGLNRLIAANGGSVALFSGVANWLVVERALDAGASGFVPKTVPLKTLGHAIRFIADGETYLPAEYMRRKKEGDDGGAGLKPRELRVLGLLCEGMQNKEIGRELGLVETIVKMDVKSICTKLGAGNRTQAVIEARKRELF